MNFLREAFSGRNRFVLRLALIAAIGGFLFGYDTGVISGALLYINKALHASKFEQQAFVGSLLIGAVVGAILAGYAADALSRRRTKLVAGVIYVAGALASAFSQTAWELIISRFVLGIAVGAASFVVPMYISELAPKRIRGGVTSFNQLMIVSGIFIAYIVNWALKDAADNWRWMLGLGAVPGLALAIGMLFQPFSPRWLVEKGRDQDAREVLVRTRGSDEDVDSELEEIKQEAEQEGGLRDLWAPGVRAMVLVGIVLAIAQQVIGVNTVIYYSPTILKFTGLSSGSAITEALSVGVTDVIATIVAILLLDRVGRRALLIVGTAGCVVSLVALGVFFDVHSLQHDVPWMALVCMIAYIASFGIGLGPVFWLMISEIFPLRVRSSAMSISTVGNWASNFVVSTFFLTLVSAITREGTFWLYAGFGVLAIAFFVFRLPETKDRSLEEIAGELSSAPAAPAADSPSPRPRPGPPTAPRPA